MSEGGAPAMTWVLLALSIIADLLGIFSFLGLSSNQTIQVAAMIMLGLVALAAAVTQLISALRVSLSYRGTYHSTRALQGKIVGSVMALLVAFALIIGAAFLAADLDQEDTPAGAPGGSSGRLQSM